MQPQVQQIVSTITSGRKRNKLNILMSTSQISTLVEDSNAEKGTIMEVKELDHTFRF